MAGQRRVIFALGSNLGDRVAYLRAAVASLPGVVKVSSVWETAPVGGPDGQGAYLNMVVECRSAETPRQLLEWCRTLEAAAGRRRVVHWGPRTLDVDLLWVDGETVDDDDLVVPHPRLGERPFVLAPLEEVAPDLVDARWRERLGEEGLVRLGSLDDLA